MDDDGEVAEPFPGFPKHGRYEMTGQQVKLVSEQGQEVSTMVLKAHGGNLYLYTAEEAGRLEQTGERPACALVRQGRDKD